MHFQTELKKRNCFSPARQSDGLLQWKKASQNLQNFIQSEQFNLMKSFQSPRQKSSSVTKDKINQMKSMGIIHFSNKQTERSPRELSKQSRDSNKSILLKPRYIKIPQILPRSPKNEVPSYPMKNNPEIGIQAFEEEHSSKKRDLTDQNNCLKQLVQILQTEILSYSRTITQKETKITQLKNQIQDYCQKLNNQIQLTNETQQKLSKQIQLNKCMEYIIAELNQKVSTLLSKNTFLQETVDEYKLKEEQNLADTFSQSHSSLSINSQNQKKFQYSELFKNSDIIMSDLQSQILMEDKQNWSFSGLDMSCFNKTPNKVHQVSTYPQEQGSPRQSSSSEFTPDPQIDEIIVKHQIQINKLKEKLKYYEIQNQMLRRKKQMTEKNTIEIEELRFRIQKLSKQNRLMQTQNKKKSKNSEQYKSQKNAQKPALSSLKECDTLKTVMKKQKKFEQKAFPQSKPKQKKNSNIKLAITQKTVKQQGPLSPKRKSPLQRKFVRRPSRSPRSSSSLDDDSEISLEFSPERA